MTTFIAVISFPLWFIGVLMTLAPMTRNGLKVSGKTANIRQRIACIVMGLVTLTIAYWMVSFR